MGADKFKFMSQVFDFRNSALLVVDLQNDFCPGGSLAVPEGDLIVADINSLAKEFAQDHRPVFYSKDSHPKDHVSFTHCAGPWPPHCVIDTWGWEFHPALEIVAGSITLYKGYDQNKDDYSVFAATLQMQPDSESLTSLLSRYQVTRLFICGLATDYCVKATAVDSVLAGFETTVLQSACRGVNLEPGDSNAALGELESKGALIL